MPRWVLRQLAGPHGLVGRLFGYFLNGANGADAVRAVARLAPKPGERLLDLGFGGGVGLRLILEAAPEARVVGVEPSDTMRARAQRKFSGPIASGALTIADGTAAALPLADASVDGVLTMNTVYFWPDLPAGLAELRRILRPTGRLVAGIAPASQLEAMGFREAGYRVAEPEDYAEAMRVAGFGSVVVEPPPSPTAIGLVIARVAPLDA